jgi:SAM-dependent methyltransferase
MPRNSKTPPVSNRQLAAYRDDLAYIHDAGFGGFAAGAAPWLLSLFRSNGLEDGLVIDLGCGSGIWARELLMAGYRVLGFDISPAMVALARKAAPRGEFHAASFVDAPLRPCVAVTAIGEIFNYRFDSRNTSQRLDTLFERVHGVLRPGGLFVFDVALSGRIPEGRRRTYSEGKDWACLYEGVEDRAAKTLTRTITTFRKVGRAWRRDSEVHHLRLYERGDIMSRLRSAGFRVQVVDRYGKTQFPDGYLGFVAKKP